MNTTAGARASRSGRWPVAASAANAANSAAGPDRAPESATTPMPPTRERPE